MTPHFSMAEFTRSDTAVRLRIDNDSTPEHMAGLARLALAMEVVRALLGEPIIITSGYRPPELIVNTLSGTHCDVRPSLASADDGHAPDRRY